MWIRKREKLRFATPRHSSENWKKHEEKTREQVNDCLFFQAVDKSLPDLSWERPQSASARPTAEPSEG
jgi:hypothetical protein